MKISTKGRYGLKAMFDLALNYGNGPISLTLISERQNISINYLEQLMTLLKKGDLVISQRGSNGGYELSRKPEEITVGEVFNVLVGSLAPIRCVEDDTFHSGYCVTKSIYKKLYDGMNDVVNNITLKDMCDDYNKHDVVDIICECKS